MACPPHVHRVVHEADPFEWYVEVHAAALADARLTPPVAPPALRDPGALVTSLSAITRSLPRRSNPQRLRTLAAAPRPAPPAPRARDCPTGAALIPHAAAHVAALIRLFLDASAPA